MSLLEKITVIQDVLIEMSANQKTFYEELEKVQEKLDRLLASGDDLSEHDRKILREMIPKADAIIYDDEKLPEVINGTTYIVDTTKETEKEDQDLTQVLLFKQTDKAFLVVKHGFQVWVAKSHLENAKGYDLGNTYDLKIKEKSKWVLKKLAWKPFEVFKD